MINRAEQYSSGLMSEAPWFHEFKKMVLMEEKYTVSYSKLRSLLIDHYRNKIGLKADAKISSGTYVALNRNQHVSKEAITRNCDMSDCKVEDVFETFLENSQMLESKGE